jgi:Ca2+-binding RTX toxin-like protein
MIDDSDGTAKSVRATRLLVMRSLRVVVGNSQWRRSIWARCDGRGDLLIQSNVGATTVKHFKSGDLGIVLNAPLPESIPLPTITNTKSGTTLDDNRLGDVSHKAVVGTAANDKVLGLSGRDEVYGSAGDDIVAGGTGVDVAYSQDGNDAVFADSELTEAQLRTYIDTVGDEPSPPARCRRSCRLPRAEWPQGGLGETTRSWAAMANDIPRGGGKRLLVGGAGHDVIDGDDDYGPAISAP